MGDTSSSDGACTTVHLCYTFFMHNSQQVTDDEDEIPVRMSDGGFTVVKSAGGGVDATTVTPPRPSSNASGVFSLASPMAGLETTNDDGITPPRPPLKS